MGVERQAKGGPLFARQSTIDPARRSSRLNSEWQTNDEKRTRLAMIRISAIGATVRRSCALLKWLHERLSAAEPVDGVWFLGQNSSDQLALRGVVIEWLCGLSQLVNPTGGGHGRLFPKSDCPGMFAGKVCPAR